METIRHQELDTTALEALGEAHRSAQERGHSWISGEDILIGLATIDRKTSDGLFKKYDIDPKTLDVFARAEVKSNDENYRQNTLSIHHPKKPFHGPPSYNERAREIFRSASWFAKQSENSQISSANLLEGILDDDQVGTIANQILDGMGLTYDSYLFENSPAGETVRNLKRALTSRGPVEEQETLRQIVADEVVLYQQTLDVHDARL